MTNHPYSPFRLTGSLVGSLLQDRRDGVLMLALTVARARPGEPRWFSIQEKLARYEDRQPATTPSPLECEIG